MATPRTGCAVARPIPDLRYATKPVHEQFESIVLGGAREMLGMPSFKRILNAEQVRAGLAFLDYLAFGGSSRRHTQFAVLSPATR